MEPIKDMNQPGSSFSKRKSGPRCAVCYEYKSAVPDRKFFSFPSNEEMCKKWVSQFNRPYLMSKTVVQLHRNFKVCSCHFKESDYAGQKFRLNSSAYPSLNIGIFLGKIMKIQMNIILAIIAPVVVETTDSSTFLYDMLSSNNTNKTSLVPRSQWSGAVIQQVVTLSVIIFLTLVGNTIIVLVLSLSRYRKRSSRVNIFILNLAIGDLAVCCITMTSELLFEVFGEWKLGPVACKIIVYAQIVTLASTTFILTSMSYDRYLAICRPLKSTGGVKQAKRLIVGSWMLAFVFAIPQIFIFVQVEEQDPEANAVIHKCESKGYTASWQRKVYFTWLTIYILVVPAVCICYCYINVLRTVWKAAKEHPNKKSSAIFLRRSQNAASMIPRAKIKTLKLTICIIASFIICWTPYFIVNNIRIYSNYTITVSKNVILGVQTLALLNSALNPIFYGYFNVHLRKDFKEIVYRKKDLRNCLSGQSCVGITTRDSLDVNFSTSGTEQTSLHIRRHKSFTAGTTREETMYGAESPRKHKKSLKCKCAEV